MAYDRYPAIDETNNFPVAVRTALVNTTEFHDKVVEISGEGEGGGGGGSFDVVDVETGLEARTPYDTVLWKGGTSRPANMLDGDIWLENLGGGPVDAPVITTTALNSMIVSTAFNQAMAATGIGPFTWSATGLPAGLSLSSAGNLTGTPTSAGSGSATITATNSGGSTNKVLSWTVSASATAPVISASPGAPAGVVGNAYSWSPGRTGTTPMGWSVTAGSLPTGLSINSSTGAVSGSPTAAGTFNFTLQATNSAGSNTRSFSIVVTAAEVNVYSVFGSTPPATPISYTDGEVGSWNSHMFYVPAAGASLESASIIGARLYVPAGSPHIGQTWRAALVRRTGAGVINGASFGGQAQFDSNGTKTEGSILVEGWNELNFASEWPGVDNQEAFMIGVQIGVGGRYLHVASGMSTAFIPAPSAVNFVLAETEYRSWYRDDQYDAVQWYGIDVKVRAGS